MIDRRDSQILEDFFQSRAELFYDPPLHTHVWYSLMASLFVRLQRLEESLKDEPEEQKSEKRAQHAVKETEFLRLKRSRLGVDDFDPLKVIGRGAFGEVITFR